MFPVHGVGWATYWIFSGNDFDIICLCYSIIIDNDIFIQGMDITGSQFLDLAQIVWRKLRKSEKVLNVPHSPL